MEDLDGVGQKAVYEVTRAGQGGEEKYRGLAMAVADKDRTEEILKVVYGLEKQKDISTLISLLSESRQT